MVPARSAELLYKDTPVFGPRRRERRPQATASGELTEHEAWPPAAPRGAGRGVASPPETSVCGRYARGSGAHSSASARRR